MSFNVVDIILLLCFIPAIIGGIRKGFVRQVAALIALILGIWGGLHFSSFVSNILRGWLDTSNTIIDILSFTTIFILVILAVTLVGRLIEGVIKIVLLGWLNRVLGIIFAVIKYALIFSIIIYLLSALDSLYDFLPDDLTGGSKLYIAVKSFAPKVFPYIQQMF
jgi:Uncharacterized membrane protein, required for colicin V production